MHDRHDLYDFQVARLVRANNTNEKVDTGAATLVPNATNPQALNRYSYVLNNPLKYTDPTGHMEDCGIVGGCGGGVQTREEIYRFFADHGEKPWMAEAYAMLHDAEVAKAIHDPNAQSYQEIADALFKNTNPKNVRVHWDKLIDPTLPHDFLAINAAPILLADAGVLFVGATFLPCATGVGCGGAAVMVPTTIPAAAGCFWAAANWEKLRYCTTRNCGTN